MPEFPALPLWTDAYIADTTHLTDAEHGRYLLLLMALWRAPERRLPNNDAWLARRFRRSVDEIATQFRPLIEEFCVADAAWLYQKRLKREWEYVSARSKKQSARAKSRWEKEKSASRGNASPGKAPTPTPTPTDIGGGGDARAHAREAPQIETPAPSHRETILAEIGADPASGLTGPNGRVLGRQADMIEVRKWSADLGLTEAEQIAVIREAMAQKRDGPPASFRYFTPMMQRLATAKAAPPLSPDTATGERHASRPIDSDRLRRIVSAAAEGASGYGRGSG